MANPNNLQNLEVWKKAVALSVATYSLVSEFPKEEKFGFTSQITRAAVSIAANIAEGAGRNSDREFAHFLGIARGSSYDLVTLLAIAGEIGYLDQEKSGRCNELIIEILKMIFGLKTKMNKQ